MILTVWKNAVLWYLGGMMYVSLEFLWRGWSHSSMFLVGGFCFLLIGWIGDLLPGLPLFVHAVFGGMAVTVTELISGLVINVHLGLRVWDYSWLPYNLMGQVCVPYFFLWIWVSFLAVLVDGFLRKRLFGETRLSYRII